MNNPSGIGAAASDIHLLHVGHGTLGCVGCVGKSGGALILSVLRSAATVPVSESTSHIIGEVMSCRVPGLISSQASIRWYQGNNA